MNKFVMRAAFAALALTAATPAMAEDRLSLTLTPAVVSEYYFRGISQTDGHPAFQLGGEGAFKINDTYTGYLGFWGSNVDFNNSVSAETDLLGGFRASFDKLSLDLGMIRYMYLDQPSNNDTFNFTEVKLTAAYDFGFAIPSAGIYYSPNFQLDSGDATYLTAGVTVPLPVTQFEPKIIANIGQQTIDKPENFFGTGNTDDKYLDWNIGLFASYWGFTAGLQYVDSDLKKSHCANGSNCGPAAVVSLSYAYSF
ncbi:MAG: TorF family putative porin [Ferrovibrio sp.]|jgi:uncharacterized protein (TIGR02001 family)|uniref:TorF family putative porin n=1 Tax=Ferrovibrio sp. TaxID=1917215 RepID=UPI00391A38AD